jgi:outer membrane protein assembly factor BamB
VKDNPVRCTLIVAALSVALFSGADWTRLRGPGGVGVSEDRGLPVTWSATENVVWKTPLPGFGASSPITLGEKIFLTCYSGYGMDQDNPGRQEDLLHHVVCIDRTSGKILWDRRSQARLPEADYGGGQVNLHGYASGTPVTDGKAVYAFFGRSGAWAYDLDGKLLWKVSVGRKTHSWGSGASPILAGDLLIVNASVESESLVALDKANGNEVWRTGAVRNSWSTPLLVDLPDGGQEVVVSMEGKVLGLELSTGKQLWECAGVDDYVCPMVIAHQGIVYVTGGRKPQTMAIRAGGRGDVTQTRLVWEIRKASKVPTPLYHEGLLYWVDNSGIACCVEADTGKLVYEKRLKISGGGDKVYASVVLADGKLYAVSRQGGTVVLAAGRRFEQLAHNDLGDESVFNATPVVSRGQLLLRSNRFLYCIGSGVSASN